MNSTVTEFVTNTELKVKKGVSFQYSRKKKKKKKKKTEFTPAQIKSRPEWFESRQDSLFLSFSVLSCFFFQFFIPGVPDSCGVGDKEYPFTEWRNQIWQSLEEGAGKRCSECVAVLAHYNNNNNVHLSCAHQCPERSHDTY